MQVFKCQENILDVTRLAGYHSSATYTESALLETLFCTTNPSTLALSQEKWSVQALTCRPRELHAPSIPANCSTHGPLHCWLARCATPLKLKHTRPSRQISPLNAPSQQFQIVYLNCSAKPWAEGLSPPWAWQNPPSHNVIVFPSINLTNKASHILTRKTPRKKNFQSLNKSMKALSKEVFIKAPMLAWILIHVGYSYWDQLGVRSKQ